MKTTPLRSVSLSLLLAGLVLTGVGLFAQSNLSPVGQLDCGCGGKQECVTKRRAVNTGLGATTGGVALIVLGSTVGLLARKPRPVPAG